MPAMCTMSTSDMNFRIQNSEFRMRLILIAGLALFLSIYFLASPVSLAAQTVSTTPQGIPDETRIQETFFRGKVTEILGVEEEKDFGEPFTIQRAKVELRNEPKRIVEIEYGFHTNAGKNRLIKTGDQVVVVETSGPVETSYAVTDVYRLNALWLILGLFFFLAVIFAGKRGFFAFIGLGFTIFVLMWYMVPRLAEGVSPLKVTTVGVLLIASISLYVAHGFRRRTHIAFLSTIVSIAGAYLFSALFVQWMRLFGSGTETAFYLQSVEKPLDLHGLLLAGMIFGALGVLDDITTAQAAAVEEIHLANPALSRKEIYRRGLSVGKEHISSLVNTLVLAYTGASLPLLLLFYIYPRPFWVTLNSELIMEEVIRTLVGSMTLIIAVPLTTLFAAAWISYVRNTKTTKVTKTN